MTSKIVLVEWKEEYESKEGREDEKEEEMDTTGGDQQQYMEWDQLQEDYEEELTFRHEELSGQEALLVTGPSIAEYNRDKS